MNPLAEAISLLATLRASGVRLADYGDRLHIEAPRGVLTADLRDRLAAHKADLIVLLSTERQIVGRSLTVAELFSPLIEIATDGSTETIFLASSRQSARDLSHRGVNRGRIIDVDELRAVAAIPAPTSKDIQSLLHLKIRFGGTITGVEEAHPALSAAEASASSTCRPCGGRDFWESIHGVRVCGTCHPPPSEVLVAGWHAARAPPSSELRKIAQPNEVNPKNTRRNQVKLKSFFDSRFLKASDLNGREVDCTIAKIHVDAVGDGEKPVVYFEDRKKGLVLNKTNYQVLVEALGEETDNWVGEPVTLFSEKVTFKSERVDAVRLKARTKEKSSPAEDDAAEVPF